MRRSFVSLVACFVLAAVAGTPAVGAGRDYAYLFVQGKITEARRGRPLVGATVRLTRGSEVFEATSDLRGTFKFDKLPVETYDLEILTAEGDVIRRVRRFDTANLDLTLLDVRVGKRRGRGESGIVVEPGRDDEIRIATAEPQTRWGRLGKELLVFLGIAGLLAL